MFVCIVSKVLWSSCDNIFLTFSRTTNRGLWNEIIFKIFQKTLLLSSLKPCLNPAIENGWHGNPPVKISCGGTSSGFISYTLLNSLTLSLAAIS